MFPRLVSYNGWPAIRAAVLVCEKDCINGELDYQFKQSASSTTQGPSLKMKWGEGSYIQDKGDYCASEGGYCACGGWISYGRGDTWTTSASTGTSTRFENYVFLSVDGMLSQ
jgi:hypothetical protein